MLRLDKQVYNEIITYPSSLQKGLAIWTTATILITLSAVRFFTGVIDFLEVNLYFFSEEATSEELLMMQTLIDQLQVEFQQSTFTSIFSSLIGSVSASVVGLIIVFLVLKYLLRKDPQPKDLAIIYLYKYSRVVNYSCNLCFQSINSRSFIIRHCNLFLYHSWFWVKASLFFKKYRSNPITSFNYLWVNNIVLRLT